MEHVAYFLPPCHLVLWFKKDFHAQEPKKSGTLGRVGMRDVYWKHIVESKKRLSEENPDKSKHEILGLARAESGTQIQHQVFQ